MMIRRASIAALLLAALVWATWIELRPATARLDIWVPKGAKPTYTATGRSYNPCVRIDSMNVVMDLTYWFQKPFANLNRGKDCGSGLGLDGRKVRFVPRTRAENLEELRSFIAGLILTTCFCAASVRLGGTILARRLLCRNQ